MGGCEGSVHAHAIAEAFLEPALIKKQFQSQLQPINCGIFIASFFFPRVTDFRGGLL